MEMRNACSPVCLCVYLLYKLVVYQLYNKRTYLFCRHRNEKDDGKGIYLIKYIFGNVISNMTTCCLFCAFLYHGTKYVGNVCRWVDIIWNGRMWIRLVIYNRIHAQRCSYCLCIGLFLYSCMDRFEGISLNNWKYWGRFSNIGEVEFAVLTCLNHVIVHKWLSASKYLIFDKFHHQLPNSPT